MRSPSGEIILGGETMRFWDLRAPWSVAGPMKATEFSTLPVALQTSDEALQSLWQTMLLVGANRGRGQAYPSGSVMGIS